MNGISLINYLNPSNTQYGVDSISRPLKIMGIFCKYRLFNRALLQKRPIILRSLLSVATPYFSHGWMEFELSHVAHLQLWFQLPFIRDPASDPTFQVWVWVWVTMFTGSGGWSRGGVMEWLWMLCVNLRCMYRYTHTHTHMHTHSHTCIYTHTDTYIHKAHICVCTHTSVCTHIHTHTHKSTPRKTGRHA